MSRLAPRPSGWRQHDVNGIRGGSKIEIPDLPVQLLECGFDVCTIGGLPQHGVLQSLIDLSLTLSTNMYTVEA